MVIPVIHWVLPKITPEVVIFRPDYLLHTPWKSAIQTTF